ncbi:MAG TPA: cyclodeaminase/cyclohydrolase family protein [Candidatus Izemoplasmatales bacterium]|nr:cyclodeaminase/cyclohydrolase family protein [Candidatus Izemoplasmatales bacterium]
MKMIDNEVKQFLNAVDSPAPAPGGGSVSALVSALGVCLLRMVGHLTIGKKKFSAFSEDEQKAFLDEFARLEGIRGQLEEEIDKDTIAFNKVMAAYKLPKETEEEQAMRKNAIEMATKEAIETPYQAAVAAASALSGLDLLLKMGNKNAISDLGVAVLLLAAGIEGALFNVRINLPVLSDEKLRNTYKEQCDKILAYTNLQKTDLLNKVYKILV